MQTARQFQHRQRLVIVGHVLWEDVFALMLLWCFSPCATGCTARDYLRAGLGRPR